MFINTKSTTVTPADYHMSTHAHAAQERPLAPFKAEAEAERHSDLPVSREVKPRRGIRRNMTND